MTRQADSDPVALGFKVRTAWAQAVALGGPIGERRVLERRPQLTNADKAVVVLKALKWRGTALSHRGESLAKWLGR